MSEDFPPEIDEAPDLVFLRKQLEAKSFQEVVEAALSWAREAKIQRQTGEYWCSRAMELSRV